MKKISIILPVYNEESVLEIFHSTLTKELKSLQNVYSFEIIYILDKSSDNSLNILKKIVNNSNNVKVISLSKRFGHQMSLVAGMDQCQSDAVIMMDSDLQHPPRVIHKLIEQYEKGFDIVHTTRLDSDDSSYFKKITSKLFYKFINKISDIEISASAADFRLISKKVLSQFQNNFREQNQFLRGLFHWVGFNHTYVEFKAEDRVSGQSKYNIFKLVNFATTGIVSFSKIPLRISIYFGLLISFISFIYIFYVIMIYMFSNETPQGWASLAILISFIGGIQLIFLGVIGEYISNIFEEVKSRPLYIIDQIFEKEKNE